MGGARKGGGVKNRKRTDIEKVSLAVQGGGFVTRMDMDTQPHTPNTNVPLSVSGGLWKARFYDLNKSTHRTRPPKQDGMQRRPHLTKIWMYAHASTPVLPYHKSREVSVL